MLRPLAAFFLILALVSAPLLQPNTGTPMDPATAASPAKSEK